MNDFNIILNNMSVSVPAKVSLVEFEILNQKTIPVMFSIGLKIIAELNSISLADLKAFFNFTDNEVKIFISELINTKWVRFNEFGDLIGTERLEKWKKEGKDTFENAEVKIIQEIVYLDLITKNLQDKTVLSTIPGAFQVSDTRIFDEVDLGSIFSNQYANFKVITKNIGVKNPQNKLYRIRGIDFIKITELTYSINFFINPKSTSRPKLEVEVNYLDKKLQGMFLNSGLYSEIISKLSRVNKKKIESLSFANFCFFVGERFLESYYNFEKKHFNLLPFLRDIERNKIQYSDDKSYMIGPVFLEKNAQIIYDHLNKLSKNIKVLPLAIWKPSSSHLFGNSPMLRGFTSTLNRKLKNFNSAVFTIFPMLDEKYQHAVNNRFFHSMPNYLFSKNANRLNEMEIFVIPGSNGIGFCQYHVSVNPSLGYPGIPIPIGFVTTEPKMVARLWGIAKKYIDVKNREDITNKYKKTEDFFLQKCIKQLLE